MITALLRAGRLIALIVAGAILYWLLSDSPWYRCLEFSAIVGASVLVFLWVLDAREKEREETIAWLAIRTLVIKTSEVESFKAAYEARNVEDVQRAKEEVLAAIRSLQ